MRTKIIDLNDQDYPLAKGEQRVTPFVATASGYEPDDRRQKTAACDDAIEFAHKIEPEPGRRVILVSAVGDFEHYEGNKKADAFPYNAIMGTWPADVGRDYFARFQHRVPKKWGYECFVTIFNEEGNQVGGGNTFYEHMNRFPKSLLGRPTDPHDKADARCGNILASFWNPRMHRVEIIQEVWESKLPKIVAAIDRGDLPGISMACDIPFDRCFECGNLAVTANDYCEHLNRFINPRGAIYPGRKAAIMLNDFPVFFDSTITANPAAVEGRTLMKVASMENSASDFTPNVTFQEPDQKQEELIIIEKSANCNCEMLQQMRRNEPALPDRIMQSLQTLPIEKVLMYLGLLGIVPKASELIGLLFNDFSPKASLEGDMVESILPKVVSGQVIIRVSKMPHFNLQMPRFSDYEFNNLADRISSFVPLKSYAIPYMMGRHKQASVMNIPLNVNNLSERARLIILIKSLLDPTTRCIIEEVVKDPRVLRNMSLRNIYKEDLKKDLMPIYDYENNRSANRLSKYYGG